MGRAAENTWAWLIDTSDVTYSRVMHRYLEKRTTVKRKRKKRLLQSEKKLEHRLSVTTLLLVAVGYFKILVSVGVNTCI